MRFILAAPLLLVAACGVDNDTRNDQVTLEYDASEIENAAAEVGNTAERAAQDVGDAARNTGREIRNEIGDIDVDVDVRRNAPGNSN